MPKLLSSDDRSFLIKYIKTYNLSLTLLLYPVYNHSRSEVMYLNILISTLSQTPIYEQIKIQIKELILSGRLKSGEQLPSIRLMAKDLKVGIVTVKRAYEELEKDGIVVNLQGRGCFVQDIDTARVKAIHLDMLREKLLEIRDFCESSGISNNELIKEIDNVYGGKGDD
jgi:GntR family transcriptional regulator